MKASVLHIDECPNWLEAGERLTAALAQLDRADVVVDHVLIDNPEDAKLHGFAGSPTLLVDGRDLFPEGAATEDLACRVYRTSTGLAGLPTTAQIVEALGTR